MNYLAHLALAGPTAESLLGNLAGDFVKGPLHERFTPGIRAGIIEHRRIDAFTDSHPDVAAFRHVLIPEYGHYARVIADVFFDHFLAASFEQLIGSPLEDFVERAWERLDPLVAEMPERLQYVYPRMRDQQWMLGYREIDGIAMALRGLSRRLSRHPELHTATRHLTDSRDELETLFHSFFPQVEAFAAALR